MDNKELTAKELFENIKDRKEKINNEELNKYYSDCLELIKKFEITGQKKSLEKLYFHITCMEREIKLLELGIDTFINYQDIKEFLDRKENKEVLIVELENYPRDIPDEIVDTIAKTKDIFTQLYVIFTDYTGEVKKELKEKKKKEKDPILLGAFVDNKSKTKLERFYYLGDWIDEYCDLTLEKLIASGVKTHEIKLKNLDDIKTDINNMVETRQKIKGNSSFVMDSLYKVKTVSTYTNDISAFEVKEDRKKGFFKNIKTKIKGLL